MDINKVLKDAISKIEAQLGLTKIDESGLKMIEEWANIPMYNDDAHMEDALLDLKRFIRAVEIINYLRKEKPNKISKKHNEMGVKAHQITIKNFQRRVSIAEFVLFGIYTTHELLFNLFSNKPLLKHRINWKLTQSNWNIKHPSDIMSNPNVFRTTFYRILREPDVLDEVLKKAMTKQWEFANKNRVHSIGNEIEEVLKKYSKYVFEHTPELSQHGITEEMVNRITYSLFLFSSIDYEKDNLLDPNFPIDRLSFMRDMIMNFDKHEEKRGKINERLNKTTNS